MSNDKEFIPKHGELIKKGKWADSRWCDVHKTYHGPLYPCEYYSQELLLKVKEGHARLIECLQDEKWVADQLEKGTPPEVIEIMRIFVSNKEDKLHHK